MDLSFTGSLASIGSEYDGEEEASTTRLRQAMQDQILRALMLNYGLLEDFEVGQSIADLGGTSTLRGMRRTGPLGDVGEDAQTTLLGSTLYEYNDQASPIRAADARLAALDGMAGFPAPAPLAATSEEFARLRLGLDRILGEASQLGSTIGSQSSDTHGLADTVRHLRLGASLSTGSAGGLDGTFAELETPRSGTDRLLAGDLSLMEEEVLRMIRAGGGGTPGHFDESLRHAATDVSLGESLPRSRLSPMSARSRLSPMSARSEETQDVLETSGSTLLVGLGGASHGMSQTLESDGPEETSEEVLESFAGMLQRLAGLDVTALDESLARGVRRAEEQTCSICLESFKSGELLTELPCRHFFHVDCVALWFQRSTRCPLCRSGCHVTAPRPLSAEADVR